MKSSASLEHDTLLQSLELNRAGQVELLKESSGRDDVRAELLNKYNEAKKNVFDSIGDFTDCPSAENRRRLTEFRLLEREAQRKLEDFEIITHESDINLLLENEQKIIHQLKHNQMFEGDDCLNAEFENLREQLKKDLPRFLSLFTILNNTAPGRIAFETVILRQLDFRKNYENDYQILLKALKFEGNLS